MEPNEEPFKTNITSCGIFPKKDEDGKIKIIGLVEGSPAQKKGLKVGDEITGFRVDGTAGKEDIMRYFLDDAVIDNENKALTLQITRKSGKQREVVLKKDKLLPVITNQ